MPQKPQNYLPKVFFLTGLVILLMLSLNYIPDAWLEKYNLREMDILSDIRSYDPDESVDSLVLVPEPPRLDTCRTGLTCFDDFSPEQTGLDAFYKALGALDSLNRPVRIAFFSDSFTEGDIFSGDLRAEFQSKLGGCGVGMMPLTSTTAGFRRTVIHSYGGWNSYSLINNCRADMLGISGEAFVPSGNSWVYYAGVNRNIGLDTCKRVSVFYSLPAGEVSMFYKINKGEQKQVILTPSEELQRMDINEKCGNISLSFPFDNRLVVYGVSLEDTTGVLVDNFAMRGSAGFVLKSISQKKLEAFNRLTHYDLLIFQYGLNVMEANKTKYSNFKKNMIETIQYFQSCFPETSFLMIGIPDRSMRKNGTYQTMPGVHAMNEVQKSICAETGIVFWNLYEAMGGENSMVDFVNAKPPKANKDYTHLTFSGGEYLGSLLYETMMYEKERYDKKTAYQKLLEK